MPQDEQLNTVTLASYGLKGSSLQLSLALQTNAGDSIPFILPVSIV
jgi:hypothetical protein